MAGSAGEDVHVAVGCRLRHTGVQAAFDRLADAMRSGGDRMGLSRKNGGDASGILPGLSILGAVGVLAFVALVAAVDYAGGYELDVFVFYFLPVAVAAWSGSSISAYAVAVLCAFAWLAMDSLSGHVYQQPSNMWWNAGLRMLSFLLIAHDVARIRAHLDRERHATQQATRELHTLCGLLPICASCKKIRDDHGYWRQLEHFIENHSDARFTHGLCKACADEMMREYENSPGAHPAATGAAGGEAGGQRTEGGGLKSEV